MSTAQPATNPAASARRTVGRRARRNAPSPSPPAAMCPNIVAASGAASVPVPNVAPAAVPAPRITSHTARRNRRPPAPRRSPQTDRSPSACHFARGFATPNARSIANAGNASTDIPGALSAYVFPL